MQKTKDIVLFGIQGSGKGTQAQNILREFPSYKYLELGNIFRALNSNINLVSSYLKESIKNGKMVKDSLVFDLFRLCSHLLEGNEALLLDGFPRTIDQLDFFVGYQQRHGRDFVGIYLDLPRELAVERIKIRAQQQNREDDLNMDTVNKRLDLFEHETLPVVEHLKSIGKLIVINANQPIAAVFKDIERALTA